MTVTVKDRLDLIRLASLVGRHRGVLSTFEAELVDECVLRFRDRGEATALTPNERLVLCDALLAMDKAKSAQVHADNEAADLPGAA